MSGQEREVLVARWMHLTRRVLPGMAPVHRWPVNRDHCFMRICLDEAAGAPWHAVIRRPAVAHATIDQLRRAVAVAESVVADPASLPRLNASSIEGRRFRCR